MLLPSIAVVRARRGCHEHGRLSHARAHRALAARWPRPGHALATLGLPGRPPSAQQLRRCCLAAVVATARLHLQMLLLFVVVAATYQAAVVPLLSTTK